MPRKLRDPMPRRDREPRDDEHRDQLAALGVRALAVINAANTALSTGARGWTPETLGASILERMTASALELGLLKEKEIPRRG